MLKFEEQYLDVLQNIEVAIIEAYQENLELTDRDVEQILKTVISIYEDMNHLELIIKGVQPKLTPLFKQLKLHCDFRLGLSALDDIYLDREDCITKEEVINCLQRIVCSLNTWTKKKGARGYLNFIKRFIDY